MTRTFLSTSQAARLAETSADTVRRAARLGRLKVAAETGNGVRLFLREDVLAWAQRKEARPA